MRVGIGTTVSYIPYLPLDLENGGNTFQIHKSKWSPREFSKRSYKVRGQGLRVIYREAGLARKVPVRLRPIAYLLSYLFAPLTYVLPCLGLYMICEKKLT